MIKWVNCYFFVIELLLKVNGILDDFKYLMVIESNFNLIVCLLVGVVGLW